MLEKNYEVVVLTRSPHERKDGVAEVAWNGKSLGDWVQFVDGAHAIVNLTGRSVNCRHTPENLREINESRINSVNAVATAIHNVAHPPRVWVQAGSLAFYGDLADEWCEENTPSGQGEAVETCRLWESSFKIVPLANTRRVLLRIGLVLARNRGALSVLGKLTEWFLGGAAGSGRQYVSWIHLADMNQMWMDAIEQDNVIGVFNATSAQSGHERRIHARAAPGHAPALVSARAGLGGAARLAMDANRTVAGAHRAALHAQAFSRNRLSIPVPGIARRVGGHLRVISIRFAAADVRRLEPIVD